MSDMESANVRPQGIEGMEAVGDKTKVKLARKRRAVPKENTKEKVTKDVAGDKPADVKEPEPENKPIVGYDEAQNKKEAETRVPKHTANVKTKALGIYYQAMLTRRVSLSIANIGGNVMQLLEHVINQTVCGKCGPEGYVRPNSAKVLNYSAPMLKADTVVFETTFECLVCNPVEGMMVSCVVKNVTKAGIRAEVPDGVDGETTPMLIFVSRDHHFQNPAFNNVQVDETIQVKVIGVRFKLNDKYVSALAQLVDKPATAAKPIIKGKKPKLVIKN